MERYDQMLLLFYRTGKWKDWNPFMVKGMLIQMDRIGQLWYEEVEGKIKWFIGWLRVKEENVHKLERFEFEPNGGPCVVPIFAAGEMTLREMRDVGRRLNRKANGNLWSWRKGRLMKVGRG